MMPAVHQLVIADQGRSAYRIVLPASPSESQKFAGAELVKHVKEMSGADLPVVVAPAPPSDYEIVLGAPATATGLGDEGYQLRTVGTRLLISGSPVRGTLYGVYGLLADHWGCRWFMPDVARIPKRKKLVLPALDETWVPKLEYRESFWWEAFDGDWAARNRQNSANARLEARHGGKVVYQAFVHTMDTLVPVDLFGAHPEYFAMRTGKRLRDNSQRCLTNPEVLAIAVASVKKSLHEHPEATIVSVSQNDNGQFCECPACKAVDDAEGSHAGTMLAFANAVAAAIEAEYPKVGVDTLAYTYTRTPPRTIRPRPNVIVRLCSIECCFSHPLEDCPEPTNRAFMKDLEGWSRLSKRLYVWDYVTNFKHYLLPFPNVDVLDRNIRTFVRCGVVGVFEEGNYSQGGGGELAELKAWVLARLLVDPGLKIDALVKEFVEGVYGPAAGPVGEFIAFAREAIRKTGEHVRINDDADREYLAPARLAEYDRLLGKAEKLAGGDAALAARITRLRMPIWYARVERKDIAPAVRREAAGRLLAASKALGLSRMCEWRDISEDYKRLEALAK
jgi:hypothetical protein